MLQTFHPVKAGVASRHDEAESRKKFAPICFRDAALCFTSRQFKRNRIDVSFEMIDRHQRNIQRERESLGVVNSHEQ
jgi:hypothetical protein